MSAFRTTAVLALLAALAATSIPAGTAPATCPVDTTPDFTDNCHHEYLLYNVDQPNVDVLILPSSSPYALRDSIILEQSVKVWDDGINSLGPAWLASGLNLHWYSVGLDHVPTAALWDPEVVIIPAEFDPAVLFGIGLQSPASWCHGVPPPPLTTSFADLPQAIRSAPGFHSHDGGQSGMLMSQCANGGSICFVLDTNFLSTPDAANRRDMFDLNSHELGHCLGIGHVGDALDFTATSYPWDDIMSYENDGHDAGHVLCVSNLNILALQQTYGNLLGQAGYPFYSAGGYVSQDPAAWSAATCAEPTASYTDLTPVMTANPLGI